MIHVAQIQKEILSLIQPKLHSTKNAMPELPDRGLAEEGERMRKMRGLFLFRCNLHFILLLVQRQVICVSYEISRGWESVQLKRRRAMKSSGSDLGYERTRAKESRSSAVSDLGQNAQKKLAS